MSNKILRRLLPLGGMALLSFGAAMPAFAQDGADVYRCSVLGERTACDKLPSSQGVETVAQLVPGSYARYLINNGRGFDQAIAEARAIGEQPTMRLAGSDAQHRVSGLQAYEQLQGRGRL